MRAAKAGGDVVLLLPDANETMQEVLQQVMRQGAKCSGPISSASLVNLVSLRCQERNWKGYQHDST